MSGRVPALKSRDVIRVLERLGFYMARQKGSHLCFKHDDGRFTVVPIHSGEDMGRGLLRQILREINISPKDFLKHL